MTAPAGPSSTLREIHEVDRRTGVWCTGCGRPGVVEIDLALVAHTDLELLARSTVWRCSCCGRSGAQPRGENR